MSYQPANCFQIESEDDFNACALEVFRYQVENIPVYNRFIQLLKNDIKGIKHYKQIPFLPVAIFKSHYMISNNENAETVFTSSGTTGAITSKHPVAKVVLYEESFMNGFERYFGPVDDYCIIGLLPAYLERTGSSLVYMVKHLIEKSKHKSSGFYLNQYADLKSLLQQLKNQNQKTILIGVTFALLDMAENFAVDFPDLIVMETGGMKGRRKEIVREELHQILTKGFGVEKIHSEYGMTELLSQAYSKGEGLFNCQPWMKILIREINDPHNYVSNGITGGVNIIDLANYYSCSFIATQDLGKKFGDHHFEIVGRFDNADLRGCNLMVQ